MKKIIASCFSLFIFIVAAAQKAQETTIEIKINGEATDSSFFMKSGLLVVFTIAILILVLRTFRGKAEV